MFFGRFKVEPGLTKKSIIEINEFKNVDGLWIPVKAKSKMNDELPGGGYMKSDYEIELESIQINPDYDALNSFSIDDIKNGAKAAIHGIPILYRWYDGKLVLCKN